MSKKFFELKYLILENFYDEFLIHKHSIDESVRMTYYKIYGNEKPKDIEAIIMKAELMQLYTRYGGKITDYKVEDIKGLIDLDSKLDVKSQLTEDEFEDYDEDDIGYLKAVYNELKKNK